MGSRTNREFNELMEKVYEQKFDNKSYIKKMIDEIKTIPTFYYFFFFLLVKQIKSV